MNRKELLQDLDHRNAQAIAGGGEERVEKQHAQGKLTARERIDLLLDPGSFVELDRFVVHQCTDFGMEKKQFPGDGVVTGYGRVDGRLIYVFAQDFTVLGGSLGLAHAKKIVKVQELALRDGAPIVGINDSGGARIQEGVQALAGYGEIFLNNTLASGVVPQIMAIMGPCAGGAVYSPALTDFVAMVDKTSYMFITGPAVIKSVTREDVTKEALGGSMAHASRSGVAHFRVPDEEAMFVMLRELVSFLPQNNAELTPAKASTDPVDRPCTELLDLVPTNPNQPYDIKDLIRGVADDHHFFEIHRDWAANIVVGFIRLDGRSVGVVANQPNHLAGCLDVDASRKGARFVRFCDAFNIPILTLEDVPGFLPGVNQEHSGIIVHGAKMIYAYCEATVPKVTVITRKAYGGAYIVMNSKHVRGDVILAYPTAEIAVMGPDGAVNIIHRREIAAAEDSEARREELVAEYRELFANPYRAASYGYVDEVIDPRDTRLRLIQAFASLENKRDENPSKKHGSCPL